MICDWNEVFNPTPEQKKYYEDKYKKLLQSAYDEQWCCTCKNYIPADDSLPGFIISYPRCKLGGLIWHIL